ncbi:MAG TPA: GAF domain-containing protein [Solirubrobacterales bacterium]|nr:GAF domain-containing protein [Solirubrobacterales bacterium]
MRDLLEIHSKVSQVAAKATATSELLEQVVREGAELIGVERCGIYLREADAGTFRASASIRGGVPLPEDISRWRAGVPGDGLTVEAVASGEPVIVEDARADPRMMPVAVERWAIRSIMAVPLVFDGEVVGLMMMDDVDRARRFADREAEVARAFGDFAAATIAHTNERLELRSKLDAASRQLSVVRRATRLEEELSEIARDGGSLQEMVGRLAGLLSKPCAIFRNDGGPIVCGPTAADPLPTLFEPGFIAHPEVQAALAENEGEGAFLLGPVASAGVRRRHVIAPIRVDEAKVWGQLVVGEGRNGISGTDIGAIRRAATLIGLQARAQRSAREASRHSTAELIVDVLRGEGEAGDVRQRAGRLGISLDARRAVAVVARRGGHEEAHLLPDREALAATLGDQARGLRTDAVAIDGAITLLLEVPGEEDAADYPAAQRGACERALAAHDPDGELIAGLSNPQRWKEGYRAAYREARQVVECIRRFSPPGGPRLLAAADLGAGGLFLASTDPETVTGFAEETVGRLLDEDANPDLLATLSSFLGHMCGIRATAVALGVHENTVRYRLGRVEEVTGLAILREPDAQAGAHLALLALVLRGRLPPSAISLCGITLPSPDRPD